MAGGGRGGGGRPRRGDAHYEAHYEARDETSNEARSQLCGMACGMAPGGAAEDVAGARAGGDLFLVDSVLLEQLELIVQEGGQTVGRAQDTDRSK